MAHPAPSHFISGISVQAIHLFLFFIIYFIIYVLHPVCFKCNSCEYYKHCRRFYHISMNKNFSFEIVHFDMWGPTPIVYLFGYSYFVTFVNDFSCCTWVYLLNSNDDVFFYVCFLSLDDWNPIQQKNKNT